MGVYIYETQDYQEWVPREESRRPKGWKNQHRFPDALYQKWLAARDAMWDADLAISEHISRQPRPRIFFGGDDERSMWTWECWNHGKNVTSYFDDVPTWADAAQALKDHWAEHH